MKRFFYLFLILALLISVFSVSAFAAEDTATDGAVISESSDGTSTDGPTETPEGEARGESEGETEKNFFALIYDELAKHADKILSALAFVGSLILAFAYKQGLLPVMRTALSNMLTKIGELKEETEKSVILTGESINAVGEKLTDAEALIEALNKRLLSLESTLEEKKEERLEREAMREILSAQVDMLYEIFMSSSLPAYQKDMIGEKISEMKKAQAERNGEK